MSEHPLQLSARLIDSGIVDTPPNRITQELTELADDVALIESFSHVVVVDTGDGLVAFDSSGGISGREVRRSRCEHGRTIRFTHSSTRTATSTTSAGRDRSPRTRPITIARPPRVVGHRGRALPRFERYDLTNGYNQIINMRQFGGAARAAGQASRARSCLPARCDPTSPTTIISSSGSATSTSSSTTAKARPTTTPGRGSARAPDDQCRRSVHLELPELRQPAEGAALPDRVG